MMIYLDNNATTGLDQRAAAVMQKTWNLGPLNPSSQHHLGRQSRQLLDQAIIDIGQMLGTRTDLPNGSRLILTSGGTEANNLALSGIGNPQHPLVVSQIEHASVLEVAKAAEAFKRTVHWLPVDSSGVICLDTLKQVLNQYQDKGSLKPKPSLVSLIAANNETGVLQPIQEAAALCRAAGVRLHVDATQWVGKMPLPFDAWKIDALTFAAHKFHGPVGMGGLLVGPLVQLRPAWHGGAQQLGQRPGTEPVALAAGTAEALRIAIETFESSSDGPQAIAQLRDHFEAQLCQRAPNLILHGQSAERLPGTSCIAFPEANRQSMLMALDLAGVACSSGSACASGSSQPSYVLQAMHIPENLVNASLRFGLSRFTTPTEIESAVELILQAYQKVRE